MRTRFARLIMTLLAVLPRVSQAQTEKPKTPVLASSQPPALTEEEKEILKYRELLENMELLQNFEKVKYLDFFAEKKKQVKGKEKPGTKSPAKDHADKKIH